MKTKILLGLMSFFFTVPEVATAYNMRDYFPLSMGDSRTYFELGHRTGSSDTSDTWSYVETEAISGTETVQGVETLQQAFRWGSQNANESEHDNIVWEADGLKIYGNTETNGIETTRATCTLPIMVLPAEMEMNVPYSSSFSCENGAYAASTTRTLEAVESVTVEAGTFNSCLKTRWVANGSGISEDKREWYCPGVGLVKSVGTSLAGNGEPKSFTRTLRWASVNTNGSVTRYGVEEQSLGGIRTAYAAAHFFGSKMTIYDVISGETPMSFDFVLNPTTLIFEFQESDHGQSPISGIDFSNAYIKMNGANLTVSDVSVGGTMYFTDWALVSTPVLGFQLTNYGPMP